MRRKITDSEADKIRSLHAGGMNQSLLRERFHLSQPAISKILKKGKQSNGN